MKKFKKTSMLLTSAALTLSMFSTVASANNMPHDPAQKIQIKVAATDTVVTKEQLIKKFRALFPKQFDFLKSSDFQMNGSHIYPLDSTVRYDLSFQKTIKGKHIYGSVTFVGDNLDVENFYYQPANTTDALFPAKTSKDKAQQIAQNFLNQLTNGNQYTLEQNSFNYYAPQQLLTEPIRYNFSFVRKKNDVAISDQRIEITILGNGELVNFYQSQVNDSKATFDNVKEKKDQAAVLQQLKDRLAVKLQYQVDYNYQDGSRNVKLAYVPDTETLGIHAISGQWKTASGFTTSLTTKDSIELLSDEPLAPKQANITVEDAQKLVTTLLSEKSKDLKLVIHSIDNVKNFYGQPVISVSYSYDLDGKNYSGSIEFDVSKGEITNYYHYAYDMMKPYTGQSESEFPTPLPKEDAMKKAINFLKEWSPSYLHHYAKSTSEPYLEKQTGLYMFTFPRVVNGVEAAGDQIHVSVAADGSISNVNISYQELEWPSTDGIISAEKAKQAYLDALNVKLEYVRQDNYTIQPNPSNDKVHYDLLYTPIVNNTTFSYLDAKTAEWMNPYGEKAIEKVVSHTWAEEELNYLINAKILTVQDPEKFKADATVTKGEALQIILKSLTYFYPGYDQNRGTSDQTLANIDPTHPLYPVVERAVAAGLIDETSNFDPDAPMTRQELAVWYINALKLDTAAQYGDIYKVDFTDAKSIEPQYVGYVALANALGLLKGDDKKFKPTKEVSYAELAVSTIRLAKEVNKKGIYLY